LSIASETLTLKLWTIVETARQLNITPDTLRA
jgi:hypothetical protein